MSKAKDYDIDKQVKKNVSFYEFMQPMTSMEVDRYLQLFEAQGKAKNTEIKRKNGDTLVYEFDLNWAKAFRNLIKSFKVRSERFKRYIEAAREDGVYWRGEEFKHFASVYDETLKYRALTPLGKAEYRTNVKRAVNGLTA